MAEHTSVSKLLPLTLVTCKYEATVTWSYDTLYGLRVTRISKTKLLETRNVSDYCFQQAQPVREFFRSVR